jgi:hypothetical protein
MARQCAGRDALPGLPMGRRRRRLAPSPDPAAIAESIAGPAIVGTRKRPYKRAMSSNMNQIQNANACLIRASESLLDWFFSWLIFRGANG